MVKPQCFVIMPFSDIGGVTEAEWTTIYDTIFLPGIESAGYECNRSKPSSGNIIADIMRSIARADVVVADLTGKNANVFYELGVRHALSGRSLLLTQNAAEVPSDLKSYGFHPYDWRTPAGQDELMAKLKDLLQGIEKDPGKLDNPVQDFLLHDPTSIHRIFQHRVTTDLQKTAIAAHLTACRHAMTRIESGIIPLAPTISKYFQWFLKLIEANTSAEPVTIFARLTHLETHNRLTTHALRDLFRALKRCADAKQIDLEYILFLRSNDSLKEPETLAVANEYKLFARDVKVLFEDSPGADVGDTAETLLILKGHRWAITHGWDNRGEILNPELWIYESDFIRLEERYTRLQLYAVPLPP